jgi:hypothetical protein
VFLSYFALKIVLVLGIALISALVSWFLVRRAKRRFNERMRRIRVLNYYRTRTLFSSLPETSQIEHYEDFIGDSSCRYNAHSYHLRCAVNPMGPCEGCSFYQPEFSP